MARYTIDFSEENEKILERLAAKKRVIKTEIIRRALGMYAFLEGEMDESKESEEGGPEEIKASSSRVVTQDTHLGPLTGVVHTGPGGIRAQQEGKRLAEARQRIAELEDALLDEERKCIDLELECDGLRDRLEATDAKD